VWSKIVHVGVSHQSMIAALQTFVREAKASTVEWSDLAVQYSWQVRMWISIQW
jgi:hypothetical protein